MKKLLFLFIATSGVTPAMAQGQSPNYLPDSLLSRWVIDVNLLGGFGNQNFNTQNSAANYPNGLNLNTGKLTYKQGDAFGGDAQVGFFFGKKRHWGIGAGFMYLQQQGFANLDNYHVEYQAYDGAGNTFRQVVTGNNVSENVTSTNLNIPLVLKYKNRFSKHWGFTADAGALVNLQMNNAYTSNASFNYEAIYKLTQTAEGTVSSYDNSPIPAASDWMITKAEYLKNNPNGNVADYFNAKRALGYSVGEGLTPTSRSGNVNYNMGSVGFLVQPSMNYFLSDHVALNLGVYYMMQPFKNNAQNEYHLTEGIGTYSSSLNNVTTVVNQSYGANIGVRFFLGKKSEPLSISSIDQAPPTQCGVCDASMAIHGLFPNQPVTVDYSLNGAQATQFTGTVAPNGDVTITNLCAGNYTNIVARIKRKDAMGKPQTISDPHVIISSQTTLNPTAPGATDGSVTFNGFYTDKLVTINYNLNGSPQAAFSAVVPANNTVSITGLGEGVYTNVVAAVNTCTVNGNDFTLVAPVPPPPDAPAVTIEKKGISTPILFDWNKSTIHKDSYHILDDAAAEMKNDRSMVITINGYTDTTGTSAYNKTLSIERANAVKRRMIELGIAPDRLKIIGHGSKSPAESNKTSEGRREDRRAIMKEQ